MADCLPCAVKTYYFLRFARVITSFSCTRFFRKLAPTLYTHIYWVHADIMLIRQIGCLSGACHNSGETKEVHKFYQENEKLYHGLLYLHKKGKYSCEDNDLL